MRKRRCCRFLPIVLAVAVCLGGTLAGWMVTRRASRLDTRGHFDALVTRAVLRVQSSFDETLTILRGMDAFFAASDTVEPLELENYVRHVTRGRRDPTLLKLMYVAAGTTAEGHRIGVGEEARFAKEIPEAFSLSAVSPGARLAPVPASLRSRPDRAEYILTIPVYRNKGIHQTPDGWAAAVVDSENLLVRALGGIPDRARLEVLDPGSSWGTVFAAGRGSEDASLVEELPVRIGGREWWLRMQGGQEFARMVGNETPAYVVQGGIAVTVVVVGVLIAMHRSRETAVALRDATEAAAAAQERFLTTMSHELRTPLTAILGHSELLQEEGLPAAERSLSIRTIRRSGEHLLGMINELLDLSKVRSGRLEIEPRVCDIGAVVQEVVDSLLVSAQAKGLDLHWEDQGGVPPAAVTDPARLRQILLNIVGNGVKFCEEGSVVVRLRGQRNGDATAVSIEVEDTGIGIGADTLERIFEPFLQADSSTSRKYGGTGLGLAISRGLARLLGGDISVRSTPGLGSTFTLTFVAQDAAENSGSVSAAGAPGTHALSGRVLIVDDSEDNRRLQRHWLAAAGADVELAEDGSACLRRLGEERDWSGVILLDMQMPGLDGYATARALREGGFRGPIIAVTANSIAGDRRRCLEAGCDEYLSKPVLREVLVAACASWMTRAPGGQREAA